MEVIIVCVTNTIAVDFYRDNEESMVKLRKLLTDSRKIRRRRRILLNIHITIIAWLIEILGALTVFFMFFLPPEIGSVRGMMYISSILYGIVVPSVYLMNNSEDKSVILDNKIYQAFVNQFYPRINQIVPENNNTEGSTISNR